MDIDDMNHMPEWEQFSRLGEDGTFSQPETEKSRLKALSAKTLYNQARAVYKYAALFCETLKGEMADLTSNLIMQNALIICPKIVGAEGADIYVLRMENASIIRTNCRELEIQVRAADMLRICAPEYKDIMLNEIEKFRLIFIEWVKLFEKDQYKDEWGLY
ncbi:hypothetical protein [Pedobacter punctiformis]|uniref:Uncharacterized protein n=1 Tax=Pedobacter punctiformis TaxID=3004097 RepID=A0ABT4L576_9SPHI|nr:hypothetical protein [Pedobacter sp. HCMS5-2]MCZ4243067.1 hypothetical protein [Pedobacter sp. HCMS5-2]